MENINNKVVVEKNSYKNMVVNGNRYCIRRQSEKNEQLSEIIKNLLLRDISKNSLLKCSSKDDMIIS